MVSHGANFLVSIGSHGNDHPATSPNLLDIRDSLLVLLLAFVTGLVTGRDDDNREVLVNQRVRTVLHLAGRIAFRVNIGDFLQLQRTLESDGKVDPASEI